MSLETACPWDRRSRYNACALRSPPALRRHARAIHRRAATWLTRYRSTTSRRSNVST
ncbi:MAG: hypothetical protein KatS3mg014_1241 [Actinomycetota bacterium]|nr:MAG: hypothetical protein KatS3mg014_1241 [Actinomycetota bacterium]